MNWDKPPEVKVREEDVNMAKEEVERNQRKLRFKEEKLAEEMLTPVQKEMSSLQEDARNFAIKELERAGYTAEDFPRIRELKLTGDSYHQGERILSGPIFGKTVDGKKSKDHQVLIGVSWNPGSKPGERGSFVVNTASVDGQSINQELAQQIADKYIHAVDVLVGVSVGKDDENYNAKLQQEQFPVDVANDLL